MNTEPPRLRDRLLRDVGLRISIVALILFTVAAIVTWHYLPPPLPQVVRLATGPEGGYYARFGEALRREVARRGVELQLVFTAGSRDNIALLLRGEVDVGLVQGGNLNDVEITQLESVASVFYEPVLLVSRTDWVSDHIEGGRIAIGVPGSGTQALATALLGDQGVLDGDPPGTQFVEIGGAQAVEALQMGEVDSALFVTSLEVPWVHTLFADPSLRVTRFDLAEAFTRYYRYLQPVVIPPGLIDLRSEIPPYEIPVIATVSSLVIRPDSHSAVIPLLIESARAHLYQGDLLADPGEFPSAYGVAAPLADGALQYFERGPSFFYRWLPFSYAFAATRITVLALPLLTLLYPLYRSAGPTYRWVIERRVYRWYRVLRRLEERMDANHDAANLREIREELERTGELIRSTHVPPSYGARLFALRAHHRLLLDRLASLQDPAPGS